MSGTKWFFVVLLVVLVIGSVTYKLYQVYNKPATLTKAVVDTSTKGVQTTTTPKASGITQG